MDTNDAFKTVWKCGSDSRRYQNQPAGEARYNQGKTISEPGALLNQTRSRYQVRPAQPKKVKEREMPQSCEHGNLFEAIMEKLGFGYSMSELMAQQKEREQRAKKALDQALQDYEAVKHPLQKIMDGYKKDSRNWLVWHRIAKGHKLKPRRESARKKRKEENRPPRRGGSLFSAAAALHCDGDDGRPPLCL